MLQLSCAMMSHQGTWRQAYLVHSCTPDLVALHPWLHWCCNFSEMVWVVQGSIPTDPLSQQTLLPLPWTHLHSNNITKVTTESNTGITAATGWCWGKYWQGWTLILHMYPVGTLMLQQAGWKLQELASIWLQCTLAEKLTAKVSYRVDPTLVTSHILNGFLIYEFLQASYI